MARWLADHTVQLDAYPGEMPFELEIHKGPFSLAVEPNDEALRIDLPPPQCVGLSVELFSAHAAR